eukprot:5534938-Prymnesium_polylepis.1
MLAARAGHAAMTSQLIELGANVRARTGDSCTFHSSLWGARSSGGSGCWGDDALSTARSDQERGCSALSMAAEEGFKS